MRLINEQPMATLPEKGIVFVEFIYDSKNELDIVEDYIRPLHVIAIKELMNSARHVLFHAWSYEATTREEV